MDVLWQWGLGLIATMQSGRTPILDAVFRAFTFLGEEQFYLLLFPTLLWCVDAKLGFRLGGLVLISFYVNSLLKDAIGHPRPFDFDPSVKIMDAEGYGLPSGHAQSAALVWGGVAVHAQKRWMWAVALALAGMIGLSRVYLGAHFPTDVLGGWGIGAVLLVAGSALYLWAGDRFKRRSLAAQIALAIAAPALLGLLFPDPSAISAMGALAGLGAGGVLSMRYLRVTPEGPGWQRGLRLVVGLAVLFVLYVGLRLLIPDGEARLHLVMRA
ncbi:MAG: phosphatase PAP2 family protein, partial [bacterium]